jgi:hypothetical protein
MFSALWLVAATLLAAAASAETVDTIVQKHVDARGGLERLRSVRTLRAAGRMTIRGRREATFQLAWQRPRHARLELTMEGRVSLLVLDGERGFMVAPRLGIPEPVPLPSEMFDPIARGMDLEGPMVDYQHKGHAVRLVGLDSVDGISAWRVEVTTPDDASLQILVDAERFLEIREVRKEPSSGLDLETAFSDYKWVDGILMPHRLTSTVRGSPSDTTTIESIELNVPVDAAEFAEPRAGAGLLRFDLPHSPAAGISFVAAPRRQ